ncbi:MAG: Rho-binding antiterminator [Bacteroidota bacterium]
MKDAKTYTPIACSLYDMLEIAAMRRQYVDLEYEDIEADGEVKAVRAFIEDLWAKDGEEFMKLTNGTVIRLDRLTKVDHFQDDTEVWQMSCACK